MSKDTPNPNTTNSELDGFLKTLKVHNKDLDACFNDAVAVAHLEALIASKVEEAREAIHSHYSGLPEQHPIPCEDCGSNHWVDYLLPHPVFNAVCPAGNGYLCLPCFANRLNALQPREQDKV